MVNVQSMSTFLVQRGACCKKRGIVAVNAAGCLSVCPSVHLSVTLMWAYVGLMFIELFIVKSVRHEFTVYLSACRTLRT